VDVKRNPNTTCDRCAKPIYRRASTQARNATKTCSHRCQNLMLGCSHLHQPEVVAKRLMVGAKNPAWKGGVTLKRPKGNYRGVRYVRAPPWALPMARKDGYIMEHRLVMALRCGFLLTRTEVVDHQDHNPANNEPTNLLLYPTNGDHKRGEAGRFVDGVANRYCPRALVLR
jgi:hypothetical protein